MSHKPQLIEASAEEQGLAHALRDAALKRPAVRQSVISVEQAAEATGADRVTIEVVPHHETVILDRSQATFKEHVSFHDDMAYGVYPAIIVSDAGPIVHVAYGVSTYRASAVLIGFPPHADSKKRALMLWPERVALPSSNAHMLGTVEGIPSHSVVLPKKNGLRGVFEATFLFKDVRPAPKDDIPDWNE